MKSVMEEIFGVQRVGVGLVAVTCCKCGVTFGIEAAMHGVLVESGRPFSCPNGHRQHFVAQKAEERKP